MFLAATAVEMAKTPMGLSRVFTLVPQKTGERKKLLDILVAMVANNGEGFSPETFEGLVWKDTVLKDAAWKLYKWATLHGAWKEWRAAGRAFYLADTLRLVRNRVMVENIPFAMSEARKRYVANMDKLPCDFLEDMRQEAFIGLLEAAEKYSPEKGVKFSTYAWWWVRDALTKAIKALKGFGTFESLDEPLGDDEEGLTKLDMLEAPLPPEPLDLVWRSDDPMNMAALRETLRKLTPERRVELRNHFGIKIPGITWKDMERHLAMKKKAA